MPVCYPGAGNEEAFLEQTGMKNTAKVTTGVASLDSVCDSLRLGDNVVWQIDDIHEYEQFVLPLAAAALSGERRVIYMRFASHEVLLLPHQYSKMYTLDAYSGFETFSTEVHNIIKKEGKGVYYIFDCLSDLQSAWATDLMIGNFFMITCPYLFEMDTIAYFSIFHKSLSYNTIANIRETTQLLINIYSFDDKYYVHPLKVWSRYSPTMFFPHLKKGDQLTPITNSIDAANLVKYIQVKDSESTLRKLDYWDRVFLKAEELSGVPDSCDAESGMCRQLSTMLIGRDPRIIGLAHKYLTTADFLELKSRLIGTGFIGGKSAGMLISRKILLTKNQKKWERLLEPHDSFYIGSDVFYTYIVQNGLWKIFMEHKTDEGYFSAAEVLHDRLLTGDFPGEIREKFQQIIEYYGQSPIIVRSSSLLEDAFGNAFAGKYESYFLVNQGSPEDRFNEFKNAVQKIFASTMSRDALAYRLQRKLNKNDEQMGLLVMRVSGAYKSDYYLPDMAGVGLSYNTYIWKSDMDQTAGMLRHVLGLGTRAVNRVEGDYPRIISLDNPLVKPYGGMDDARKFSQRKLDVLNILNNKFETISVSEIVGQMDTSKKNLIGIIDSEVAERMRDRNVSDSEAWIINFDELLSRTPFAKDMQYMLKTLEEAYEYPVDIEYTANFKDNGSYLINLLQCRPQQAKWQTADVSIPDAIDPKNIFFRTKAHFLGGSISQIIKRIIFIEPYEYSALNISQKHETARLIGIINDMERDREAFPVMLMGPGRWGTTTPALGVPVRYSQINNISILIEIALMREDLIPELSYGTHFFQDLVETGTFYIAIFPESKEVIYSMDFLHKYQNIFNDLVQDKKEFSDVIKVYNIDSPLYVMSDIKTQKLVCFENMK